ncbi:MAG: hypothetical protein CEE38_13925 [Planctomycetes bacterium B3_Pla]|nr:MAG: hypothetical protein CEE38_13925 [Planctomycetes bacterium B3_Pla]
MPMNVVDIRANLNENINHAATIIGKSRDRRRVFEAIYKGKTTVKTVDDIVKETGLSRVRVLQEGGKLSANQIVDKTSKDNQTAYRKVEIYSHHKRKVLSIVDNPENSKRYPTKQRPDVSAIMYTIRVPGKNPKIKPITIDDIDSFKRVRKVTTIDDSLRLDKMLEKRIKAGLKRVIGETYSFKDWGGEKNDLYTNKIVLKGKRRTAAFAIKGRATKGTLTPKKMGKNGDQIERLVGSSAQIFLVVYHGKIDQSINSQLEAFALGKSMSGNTIYYGTIDGNDLNRLYQAYNGQFSTSYKY